MLRRSCGLVLAVSVATLPASAEPAPAPAEVVLPVLSDGASVAYPDGASGDARVVLELVIEESGAVGDVQVVSGEEPFATAAVSAARDWTFEPARRSGTPIAARIRFEVVFVEPREAIQTHRPDPPALAGPEPVEVVVRGERETKERRMTRAEVRQLPGAFGDPFRAIERLPGVTPVGTGLPSFYVRGAPPGNVGYFLDGIRVPGLFHAGVGPSVIHPALIESVELHPGPYPARYGRFTGGIVAGELATLGPDLSGEASLRLVDAGALVSAPFSDGRGRAALGGRYSYTATVLSLIVPELELSYWDYQALGSYRFTGKDTLGLLAFGSSDFASQLQDSGRTTTFYDVEFHRVDLRYDRVLAEGGELRVATTLGADSSTIEEGQLTAENRLVAVRVELEQPLGGGAMLFAGADAGLERYGLETRVDSETVPEGDGVEDLARRVPPRDDRTTGIWIEASLPVAPRITIKPGIRVDLFNSGGTTRVGVDPRVAADFTIDERVTLVHALGIAHQRPSYVFPVPGVQPKLDELQRSVQASSGVRVALPAGLRASLTGFQAIHFALSDPLGVSRLDNGDPSVDEETRMRGRSVGLELLVERSLSHRLGGYLSYTLSRSSRAAGRVSGPSTFDRTHVLGGALAYDLGRRWRAGARGTFYTGTPVDVAYVEAAREPPRTAPFWRLDWRIEKSWLLGEGGAYWSLVLEVLNTTLNREQINGSCSAHVCRYEYFGPVTVPSLGVEAVF